MVATAGTRIQVSSGQSQIRSELSKIGGDIMFGLSGMSREISELRQVFSSTCVNDDVQLGPFEDLESCPFDLLLSTADGSIVQCSEGWRH